MQNALLDGEPTGLGFPTGETLGYPEVLAALQQDYAELSVRAEKFNADPANRGRRRGVGVAGMMYRFGKFGVARSQAEVQFDLDGGFTVFASAGEYGQGIETTFLRQAAETLGVQRSAVRLVNADTAHTLDGDVAGASRAAYWVGSALIDASRRLRAALLGFAAEFLDAPPDALTLTAAGIHVDGSPERSVSLAHLGRRNGSDRSSAARPGHTRPHTPVS
jgi:aerobic carbon-monoxide dehydrogenase large subunit